MNEPARQPGAEAVRRRALGLGPGERGPLPLSETANGTIGRSLFAEFENQSFGDREADTATPSHRERR